VNTKLSFPVNIYAAFQLLFVMVIPVLLNPVMVAITFPLVMVCEDGIYSIVAVMTLSIVNITELVLPAASVTMSV